MTSMKATVHLIGVLPDTIRWSSHLKEMLEQGWTGLRLMLEGRPEDAVGAITETTCGLLVAWMPRSELLAHFAEWGRRPLYSLTLEPVLPTDVRIFVMAKDLEMGACIIPLASVCTSSSRA